jgi:hypothetical protein
VLILSHEHPRVNGVSRGVPNRLMDVRLGALTAPRDWHSNMTTSDSSAATGASKATPPIEAWLTPIAIAAAASGVASSLGTAVMYMSYYQHRYHTLPNTPTGRLTVLSYFGVRSFLFCVGWSLLYALSYREWPALRRVTDKVVGMVAVAVLFGTALWVLMNYVIFPSKPQETPFEVMSWLRYIVFIGPPIVWVVRRFSPLAPPRPIFARKPPSPASGRRQIIAGIVITIPALLCLQWLKTDPNAGYLMILGLFIGLGALGVLVIAASLILGGLWTMFGLPGQLLVRLSPFLLVAGGTWFVFMR